MPEPEWHRANRANWDERVGVHLGPGGYDLTDLRAGCGRLNPIEETELPSVAGKRVLHLQCHFGADSLALAQRGADVVGLDFSIRAVEAARSLTSELRLTDRASFVHADVYDAVQAIPHPHGFDLVFVTWGALCWLHNIARWAEIVATMLRRGGSLYLADGHPTAYVFDDVSSSSDGMPGLFAPYFSGEPVVYTDLRDYADPAARLMNTTTYQLDPPARRCRQQPDRGRHDARLAARARRGALAHVPHPRQRRLRSLSLARQAVAAAGVFPFRHAALAGKQSGSELLLDHPLFEIGVAIEQ